MNWSRLKNKKIGKLRALALLACVLHLNGCTASEFGSGAYYMGSSVVQETVPPIISDTTYFVANDIVANTAMSAAGAVGAGVSFVGHALSGSSASVDPQPTISRPGPVVRMPHQDLETATNQAEINSLRDSVVEPTIWHDRKRR